MSDNNRRPSFWGVADLLVLHRRSAGLSQEQLAALTADLYGSGVIEKPLTQQAISRIEGNADADPHQDTVEVLARALAYALRDIGYDGATDAELLRQFRNAKRKKPESRDVSPEAALLDAEISLYPEWYRRMIWSALRNLHQEISAGIQAENLRNKARRAAKQVPSGHNDSQE